MRILFALPGLHRFERGAETAFIALASELARDGDAVTLIGAGEPRANTPYRFIHEFVFKMWITYIHIFNGFSSRGLNTWVFLLI